MFPAGVAFHPRISLNGAYDLEAPLADDLDLCRAAGLAAVAVPHFKIEAVGVDGAAALLSDAGISLSSVCLPGAFDLERPERRDEQVASAIACVDACVRLGADSLYLLTGRRGALDWSSAAAEFATSIEPVRAHAEAAGLPLLIEPTAVASPISIVHTMADLVELAEQTGLGTCLDPFGCWADSSFLRSLPAAAAACGLVQISDHVEGERLTTSRGVPGDGQIGWDAVFEAVRAADYAGWYDLELMGPRIFDEGPLAAFRRAAEWTTRKLSAHDLA